MKFRNFKMVDYVIFGRGSFNQLGEIIESKRKKNCPMVFLVDHFFENKAWTNKLPVIDNDNIIFADVTDEPTTAYVDKITKKLKDEFDQISGIIGIGGGSTMDLAKAVSLMMGNEGSATDYQGWDLVKNPGVYKVGIPTLSGTGAEVSRTCVLTGPKRKLGMNSDFTPFDQIILDPELIKDVPVEQRFYTGMDCYIHCIESLEGTYLNEFSKSYGEKALDLCREIFLENSTWDEHSDDKLMMASYAGGMSIAYSQVGVAHAMSYGLGTVMHTKHGIGNCIVFNHLQDYYKEGVKEFHAMLEKWNIKLPKHYTTECNDDEINKMVDVALSLTPLWENALGKNWTEKMNREICKNLYNKL